MKISRLFARTPTGQVVNAETPIEIRAHPFKAFVPAYGSDLATISLNREQIGNGEATTAPADSMIKLR